jgi:hypothetical protein
MKMKRADMLIGMTVLAIAVSLLAIPTSHAQKPTGMSRVGWLEVWALVLSAPTWRFSAAVWQNWATWRGRTSLSSSDSQIADTSVCRV